MVTVSSASMTAAAAVAMVMVVVVNPVVLPVLVLATVAPFTMQCFRHMLHHADVQCARTNQVAKLYPPLAFQTEFNASRLRHRRLLAHLLHCLPILYRNVRTQNPGFDFVRL